MSEQREALEMLMATSRTFSIPISLLPSELKEAVSSAYLCMRAIDEIEDHHNLLSTDKSELLEQISLLLEGSKSNFQYDKLIEILRPYESILPEVSLKLGDWIKLCPSEITPNILNATSTMARGMAKWVLKKWDIKSEEDLNDYIYYVAGLVGVMLSDLWKWYDNIETDRDLAIAFGRGLQSVNILRNREEDLARGVDFYPNGWETADMFAYARKNLALADAYVASIKPGLILDFCKIPLALAHSTLDTLKDGNEKLSRKDVNDIVSKVVGEKN